MNLRPEEIPDEDVRKWYMEKMTSVAPSEQAVLGPPTVLQIELTKNCNNACIMCHKGQMPLDRDFVRSDISDIALEQTSPVFPYLKHAMLFGDGEPMLYKGFWKVVEDIRQASPQCSIDFINNGSLMNQIGIKNCMDYKVSHLGLSMGGATADTHNYVRRLSDFDRVVANYRDLQHAKVSIGTKEPYVTALIVVMKSNVEEIPKFVKMAASLGMFEVECQKLFVTHSSMEKEVVDSELAENYFNLASRRARELGVGFSHYPLDTGNAYRVFPDSSKINSDDVIFAPKYTLHSDSYCSFEQPWNTVYVLYSGKVVPDCHWWSSRRKTHLNDCGILSVERDILDIWNSEAYHEIRSEITKGFILPQCRGCGLAGGVRDKFRCADTDHANPREEHLVQVAVKESFL